MSTHTVALAISLSFHLLVFRLTLTQNVSQLPSVEDMISSTHYLRFDVSVSTQVTHALEIRIPFSLCALFSFPGMFGSLGTAFFPMHFLTDTLHVVTNQFQQDQRSIDVRWCKSS